MGAGVDLDRALCSIVLPRFTWGGHEYVGRVASWEQLSAWAKRHDAIARAFKREDPTAGATMSALVIDMARVLFPDPPAPPWWRKWTRVPPAHEAVAAMPEKVQAPLLADFWAALATMLPTPAPTGQAAKGTTPTRTTSRKPQRNGKRPTSAGDSPPVS